MAITRLTLELKDLYNKYTAMFANPPVSFNLTADSYFAVFTKIGDVISGGYLHS